MTNIKEAVELKEGLILSSDTLRSEDLLASAYELIQRFTPDAPILKEIAEQFTEEPTQFNIFYGYAELKDEEQASLLWNGDVTDYLMEQAPDGYTFGSSEGDGALIGYFRYEDE